VQAALANPVKLDAPGAVPEVEVPTAKINSTAGLTGNIDDAIESALAGLSMDSVLEQTQAASEELEINARVTGVVTKIHKDNVFFKLNGQFEGVAALHHFKEEPSEKDVLEVIVRGLNADDGLYELSIPGSVVGVSDWEEIVEGSVVEGVATGSNTGGLEIAIGSIKGFMPISQIDRFRTEDMSPFINQKLQAVVMEVNPDKRRLVLSRRAILERENEEKRKALMEELEVGQLRDGTVTKLMDFGAFVDLGGAEGLIHVSKVSWTRVKHPSEVLEVGQKVRVKVEKIGDGRISLSHRDTLEHPWTSVAGQFKADDVVKGKVTKVMDFGAFVQLAPGIEGLVHVSELAHHRVTRVSTICNQGDEIDVKILSIDTESQKMSLSHKATLAAPAPKAGDGKKDEPELPDSRELVVPASDQPLKGGTNNPSGGEQFGLKW
jgi:small subunit ribosomal protein S1